MKSAGWVGANPVLAAGYFWRCHLAHQFIEGQSVFRFGQRAAEFLSG